MESGESRGQMEMEVVTPSNTKSSPPSAPDDPKSRTMAKGVQTTFSAASNLANFLPTGTTFFFSAVLPTIYRGGQCSPVSTTMMSVLLGICVVFCFFSQFTDSFKGPDNKLVYGFVLPSGLKVFKHDLSLEVPKDKKYRLEFADVVHAVSSVVVFLAVAFSDRRVVDCFFPRYKEEMHQVMDTLVLFVSYLCSSLFLLFPLTRRGFVPP